MTEQATPVASLWPVCPDPVPKPSKATFSKIAASEIGFSKIEAPGCREDRQAVDGARRARNRELETERPMRTLTDRPRPCRLYAMRARKTLKWRSRSSIYVAPLQSEDRSAGSTMGGSKSAISSGRIARKRRWCGSGPIKFQAIGRRAMQAPETRGPDGRSLLADARANRAAAAVISEGAQDQKPFERIDFPTI